MPDAHSPNPAPSSVATDTELLHVGPLSLVEEFDAPLAQLLRVASGAPRRGLDETLADLQAAGRITAESVNAGDTSTVTWRWVSTSRAVVRDEFWRRSPDLARSLEVRLAQWFDAHGAPAEALSHAVASHSGSVIIEVIESAWRPLLFMHLPELLRALRALPLDAIADRPLVLALRNLVMLVDPDPASMPTPLTAEQIGEVGRSAGARRAIETNMVVAGMFRNKGMFREASVYAEQMMELVRVARRARISNVDGIVSLAYLHSGIGHQLAGEDERAAADLQASYEHAPQAESEFAFADPAGKLALLYAMRGEFNLAATWLDIESAAVVTDSSFTALVRTAPMVARALIAAEGLHARQATEALDYVERNVSRDYAYWPFVLHARTLVALAWGDRLGMVDELDGATTRPPFYNAPPPHQKAIGPSLLDAARANLLMALGRGTAAWTLLEDAAQHPRLEIARARLALLTGDAMGAQQITDRLVADPDAGGARSPSLALELALIRAVTFRRLDQAEPAAVQMRAALSLASPSQLLPFGQVPRDDLVALIDLVPAAAELLSERVLDRLPDIFPAAISIVVLTPSEQTVLAGLAVGKTVTDIATERYLSEGTVKTHQRHLYRKLGVNTRAEALTSAAELGLLP